MTRHDAPHSPERDSTGRVVGACDWLGRRFVLGDTVMYCIGAGRGQMMAIGTVEEIASITETRWQHRPPKPGETPTRTITSTDPPILLVDEEVPFDRVSVRVHTLVTSGAWDNARRTKPAWVNPMNITALPTDFASARLAAISQEDQ